VIEGNLHAVMRSADVFGAGASEASNETFVPCQRMSDPAHQCESEELVYERQWDLPSKAHGR
jgi:hypothetical protein